MEVGGLTALTIALSAICVGGAIGGIIAMRQNWKQAQRIESAKRQTILAKFWRDEMLRLNPMHKGMLEFEQWHNESE